MNDDLKIKTSKELMGFLLASKLTTLRSIKKDIQNTRLGKDKNIIEGRLLQIDLDLQDLAMLSQYLID